VCSEEISEDTMYLGTSKHLEISSSSQDIDFGVHADKTTADVEQMEATCLLKFIIKHLLRSRPWFKIEA